MAFTEVTRVIRLLAGSAERQIKKLTLDLVAELVDLTPVDTGWARANWVPSITAPYEGSAEAASREERESGVQNARAAQAAGSAALLGYKLPMGSLFVNNNVPYIEALNSGSSTQAPEGFVQIAIERAILQNSGGVDPT